MRSKIRQWFVDSPRAMNTAYALLLGSSILFEYSINDAGGSTIGP